MEVIALVMTLSVLIPWMIIIILPTLFIVVSVALACGEMIRLAKSKKDYPFFPVWWRSLKLWLGNAASFEWGKLFKEKRRF